MTREAEQLLSILAYRLFDIGENVSVTEEIIAEAKLQAVHGIVAKDLQGLGTNIMVDKAHAELTEVLHGIPFVTIKGYASAAYYPEPLIRSMGDVDLYVSPQYYESAIERLENCGFARVDIAHERHDVFVKNHITFELHSEIKGIPNGKEGIKVADTNAEKQVREYLSDIIETAKTADTVFGKIVVPDDFHHGIVMLLHMAGHMVSGNGVGLRHLCDWAVYANNVNIEQYKEQYENMGLWVFACQLTAVSRKYLGLPEQAWSGTWDDSFLELVLDDFLSAGNFGTKESGRGSGTAIHKNGSLIHSFAQMTKDRYKVCRSYPVLLPFGMLVYLFHYIKKMMIKRLSVKEVRSIITSGKKRNDVYKEFKLFEV